MNTLDNTKFTIYYVKSKSISLDDLKELEKDYEYSPEDIEYKYNPFQIKKLQPYNPIYSLFFELSDKSYNKISLNHEYHFSTMNKVTHYESGTQHTKPVFIKYSPLIDPIRYMTGKYKLDMDKITCLPSYINTEEILPKIAYHNNASYTDNFFSFLASKLTHKHGFVHGVDYYGSFLGIQSKFKANISDDLDYLNSSDYFSEKINKLFTVSINGDNEFANFGSRANKKKLILEELEEEEFEIEAEMLNGLDTDTIELDLNEPKPNNGNELVYEKEGENEKDNNDISENSSNNSETNYSQNEDSDTDEDDSSDDSSEDWESDSSDATNEYDEENNQYAFINDFPVQLICLEKCDGTLDELFVKEQIDEEIGAAILFQVVMILIAYQKAFHFTHNDLHTNNIMYINTDIEYLCYRYNKKVYKIPTYGKIFKIIDFGRSIYKFQGQTFFSDSFNSGGDGATQYNCEPYFNEKKSRVEPNYSFDLSRLGSSIYDFIIEDDKHPERFDDLQKTIYRWCLDDNDKNILYKRDGDERYPNFKLYKMIARTVHKHTPQEQLEFPFFKQFLLSSKKVGNVDIMDIDSLPVYV